MDRFEVGRTVSQDEDGRIDWIHVGWHEARPFVELIGWKLFIAGAGSTGIGYVVSLMGGGTFMMALGAGGALAGLLLSYALPGKQRAMVLYANGSIGTPCGTPWRPWETEIKGTHDRIVSIESRPQQQTQSGGRRLFEVVLISKRGSIVLLSHNCPEESAFGAAVQLTEALGDLRQEAADPNYVRNAAA
ncbi:hypothetical protein GCM10011321_28190 [Youhaiella tibetensis]|uniref:Uncharacterized protein n=1 Tax=Paradevosia tibetensis TaxID=1447062 RepID=A0A5B9DJK2_9HYPH|nr:hypothetical protein [Youhaiella tibetensis]QEE19186.1 hypothetical protein FNA67_02915 [Youhaiella tibetensis]GGF35463.1 hypothetical protein GCM10011321_28190 [Youhaiella tibetensis]